MWTWYRHFGVNSGHRTPEFSTLLDRTSYYHRTRRHPCQIPILAACRVVGRDLIALGHAVVVQSESGNTQFPLDSNLARVGVGVRREDGRAGPGFQLGWSIRVPKRLLYSVQ